MSDGIPERGVEQEGEVQQAAQDGGRILRALRLGNNQRAQQAAEQVRNVGDRSSSAAREGIAGIKRLATAAIATSRQGADVIAGHSQRAREAAGTISQNVRADQEVRDASKVLRQQSVPLALDVASAALEAGGIPLGRLGRVGQMIAHHGPKVITAAEVLGITPKPAEDKGGRLN